MNAPRVEPTRARLELRHLSLIACILAVCAQAAPDRPNIVFIYADDQAPWAFGASGNANAHTPNLDALAAQGARLINAFVTTPVCSPARAALMTGRYASELGISDFIPDPKHRLYNPDRKIGLNPATVTFAEVLADAGYRTGLVGKWHLGDWTESEDRAFHPTRHGFQYFMGLTGGGTAPIDPLLEVDGELRQFEGFTTDILTDHAIRFLRESRSGPFLLCLNYRAPHAPWLPVAPEDWAPFATTEPVLPNSGYPDLDIPKAKNMMREYLGSVAGVDRNVGRLLRTMDSLNLAANTVVIFSSDHGFNLGHNGIWHKGNGIWLTRTLPSPTKNIPDPKYRPNLYDNSLKVPAIVRWPGVVSPGTEIRENVSALDWFPTLIDIAATVAPSGKTVRGRSLVPLLRNNPAPTWDNDVYAEYDMVNYGRAALRAYRTPAWKLVRDFIDPDRDELYWIALDPEENINLINDPRLQVREAITNLHRMLLDRMRAIGDPLSHESETD